MTLEFEINGTTVHLKPDADGYTATLFLSSGSYTLPDTYPGRAYALVAARDYLTTKHMTPARKAG